MNENLSQLKNFEDTVLADAQREKDEIEREISSIREKELSQIESRALEEAYNIIHEGITEIMGQSNKDISVKTLAARKEVLLARDMFKSRVFDKVKNNILLFKVSHAYEPFLMKSFDDAIAAINDPTEIAVVLNPLDQVFEKALTAKYPGKLIVQYDTALIGGVIASSEKVGRYADFSLNARIDEEKKRYDERIKLNID